MFLLLFCAVFISAVTATDKPDSAHLYSSHQGLKAHKVIAAWDDAESICRSEGGYLASPINENILNSMKYFIDANKQFSTYLIGTRVRHVPGKYVSIEGIALDDMPVFNMLERLDPEEGECLAMENHSISVVPCWTPLPFICHLNDTNTNTNITKSRSCNIEGYRYEVSMDKCYKYYSVGKNWPAAQATCVADGGHLVVVNNEKEARIVFKKGHDMWIGLEDIAGNGHWKSVDGIDVEELYNVWGYGTKPADSSFKCAFLGNSDGKLYNYSCSNGRAYFVCEKRPE